MTAISQRSFAGGELAPALYARVDQSKYTSGLRTCRNFMIMRHGGATNRPGTGFVGEVKDSTQTVRLIPFIFSTEQTFMLEFGNLYMRVHAAGNQILESAQVITGVTQANPAVVTITAHGFLDGEEVYISGVSGMTQLNNRNFKINAKTANTFQLKYMDGTVVSSAAFGAYVSGGTAARVYTITTPYVEADLQDLQYVQSADVISIVHSNYPPMELSRFDTTNWVLSEIALNPGIIPPTGVVNGGAAGTTTEWVVTSVAEETFEESLQSSSTGSSATPTAGTPITVSWAAVSGAVQYYIYKKKNGIYGFIGVASGTSFIDNGLTPDVADTPPSQSLIVADLFTSVFEKLYDTQFDQQASDCDFSRDGRFLATAHANAYLVVHEISGKTFTRLPDLPSSPISPTGCAFSANVQFLAASIPTSPYVAIYSISGTTFTRLPNPAVLPPAWSWHCTFSPDGKFLVVVHDTTPFLTIYSISGTTFTKIANPAVLPPNVAFQSGRSCAFSEDSQFLAIAHIQSPRVTIYSISGTTFTKVADPAILPASFGNDVSFSQDTLFLSVAHTTTPFVTIYQRSGTTFTKLANPATLPTSNGYGTDFSNDGRLLAVSHNVTPFLTIYSISGSTFTKIADPSILPSFGTECAFSPNNGFLCVAGGLNTVSSAIIYERVGSYPSVDGYYQQRFILAATDNFPEKLWASRTNFFKNFTISSPIQNDDAVIFTMAGRQISRIRHVLDLNKLVILTASGEWTAEGDNAGILLPDQINLKQQSYYGSSKLSPVIVGGNALFVQARGSIIRDLGYDYQVDGYRGNDLTIFSAHLFDPYVLRDLSYQQTPHSIVWVVREDGVLLGLTYVREQQIFAWHRHDFDGTAEQVAVIPEGTEDVVYIVVKRTIGGVTKRYIERLKTRQIDDIVDAIFMDCALSYDGRNTTTTTMTLSGGTTWVSTETLTLTAGAAFFTASDVGNAIFLTDAAGDVIRFTIVGFTSSTVVTGKPHKTVPVALRAVAVTVWSRAVDRVSGLWHLEGKEVSVFADGFVVASPNNDSYTVLTVASGAITLDRPYAVIHVGLPITSDIETLDIDTANGETVANKKKIITSVGMIVEASRGIFAGPKPPTDDAVDPLENLMEFKGREFETYDDPVNPKTDYIEIPIHGEWSSNGRVFVRQVDPVPLSILSIVPIGMVPFRG